MSIAYGREGKIDFEAGYGFADADGAEAVTPQHRFRIASVSKPITATAETARAPAACRRAIFLTV